MQEKRRIDCYLKNNAGKIAKKERQKIEKKMETENSME